MNSPIQIRRPDVVAEIRALASLTGNSITDTIAAAVTARLSIERVKSDAKLAKRRRESERLLTNLRGLPVKGRVLTDADLYDAHGLPK